MFLMLHLFLLSSELSAAKQHEKVSIFHLLIRCGALNAVRSWLCDVTCLELPSRATDTRSQHFLLFYGGKQKNKERTRKTMVTSPFTAVRLRMYQ